MSISNVHLEVNIKLYLTLTVNVADACVNAEAAVDHGIRVSVNADDKVGVTLAEQCVRMTSLKNRTSRIQARYFSDNLMAQVF